jgi:Uri superfamily endonuclease
MLRPAAERGRARNNPDRADLQARPGTYVLWLRLDTGLRVPVGGLGPVEFSAGHYAYVGSAFGPGGIAARLGRHLRSSKKNQRWHVDYLRAVARPRAAWVSYDATRHEHRWAVSLAAVAGAQVPVAGFGSSDCRCPSHLLWFRRPPSLQTFRATCAPEEPVIGVVTRICG